MSVVSRMVYEKLVADVVVLTPFLSDYQGQPAIFTAPPPEPLIRQLDTGGKGYIVTSDVSSTPFDSKSVFGLDILRDIQLWFPAGGDSTTIEDAAERVRFLFHRSDAWNIHAPITQVVLAEASGPVENDENEAYGRIVSVRIVVEV